MLENEESKWVILVKMTQTYASFVGAGSNVNFGRVVDMHS